MPVFCHNEDSNLTLGGLYTALGYKNSFKKHATYSIDVKMFERTTKRVQWKIVKKKANGQFHVNVNLAADLFKCCKQNEIFIKSHDSIQFLRKRMKKYKIILLFSTAFMIGAL